MSVLKRKDGGWRIDIVIRRGKESVRIKRAAKGARNKAEAMAQERVLRRELEQRADPNSKAPVFEEFADDFLERYARANNKPSEFESKKGILDQHLRPWFTGWRLDEIGDEAIESYKAAKLKGAAHAHKTINNQLAVLSKLLHKAVDWKRIAFAPRVVLLKLPQLEPDFFSFDEGAKIWAAAGELGTIGRMIRFGLMTGLRHGELLGLRWSDVYEGKIVVRQAIVRGKVTTPKSHKPREVPLNRSALEALPNVRPVGDAPVFAAELGGYLTRGECRRPLWAACRGAGVRQVGWHVLRHTFASHLAMRGVPLKTIQELLGHSDIRMTMRYAHLSPDVKVDAVNCLDLGGTSREPKELQGPNTDRSNELPA